MGTCRTKATSINLNNKFKELKIYQVIQQLSTVNQRDFH
jgi:hypothetical protein